MTEKLELKSTLDRRKIIENLKEGKVGLFPTDTVWGICCRMDNESAIESVFNIKKRERNKPFLILAENSDQVKKYANFDNPKAVEISKKYWPGPLTIIFKAKKESVLPRVRAGGDTIAVRIPDYPELSEVISGVGVPVIAPSANLSGEKTPANFEEIEPAIIKAVDFVVLGTCKIKKPSTIIDCTQEIIRVVRVGAVDFNI